MHSIRDFGVMALVGVCVMGSPSVQAQEYVFRYADLNPSEGHHANMLRWWAEQINERTDGRVKFELFHSGSLVSVQDALRAVSTGLAEIATIQATDTPAAFPIWTLGCKPFGEADPWVGMRTWYEMFNEVPELKAEAEAANVKILTTFTTGPIDLISKRPIESADDLAGMRIRSVGAWANALSKLGATPVPLPFTEIYQALDLGTVDAAMNYVQFVRTWHHYEVAGYFTEANMGQFSCYGAAINLDLWNSLPADLQEIFEEIGSEVVDFHARTFIADIERYKEEMSAGISGKSVQFISLSDEERERWALAGSDFTDTWKEQLRSRGIDPDPLLSAFEEIEKKYRDRLETEGYPWE